MFRAIFASLLMSLPLQPAVARTPAGSRLCDAAVAAIDAAAGATMAQGSPGMIVEVAADGQTVFARRAGLADLEHAVPMAEASVFPVASVTKTFTAALVLSLVEDGRLSLNDRVGRYLPEMPSGAADVTLYQLLVQTSGIPDFAEDEAGAASVAVARTPEQMLAWIARLAASLHFAPGTRWQYSNSNYVLLGLIAERAGGAPLATLFDERLFRPAGLAQVRFDDPADVVNGRVRGYRKDKNSPSGFRNAAWISPTIPGAAGGLRGTAPDLVRWTQALFGGRVLQPATLDMMITPGRLNDGRTTRYGMPQAWQDGLQSDYAMGLFVKRTRAGVRLGHSGDINGFSTWLAYYPASKITIVEAINSESADLPVEAVEAAVFTAEGRACLEAAGEH